MRTVFVDYRISEEQLENLNLFNLNIIKCPQCNNLSPSISGHPDIQLYVVDESTLILHKNISLAFLKEVETLGFQTILTKYSLKENYPKDIIVNAFALGNCFFHCLKYTDESLLKLMLEKEKKLINVTQGYTKCSTAIISKNAAITSDSSIFTALNNNSFDVLFLPPGDIELPGLDYGFIGGTCGLIAPNKIAFYGNLDNYLYGYEVKNFLYKHQVEPFYLSKGKLIDRGSII